MKAFRAALIGLFAILAATGSMAVLAWPARAAQNAGGEYFVYFGTYTRAASKGIYAYRFQPSTGRLTPMGLAATTPSPAFLAVHPNGRFLYAANEHDDAVPPGNNDAISAFAIDPVTGKLSFLNKASSGGQGPAHLSVDKIGKTVLVANYGSGSVVTLPIQQDGRLGDATSVNQHHGKSVVATRQEGPHAHFITPSPDNRFALTADLGLDQVLVYRFDASKGILTPNTPPFVALKPGSGPRHLAFHPTADFVYVNSELNSTVTAFAYDAKAGSLKELQTLSTLPAGFAGTSSTAEIQIDRTGRFLYVSNRGHDSIATFSIDKATGKLTAIGHTATGGKTPRYFTLDPTGGYLLAANQASNTVVVFRVDAGTGLLTPTQQVLKDVTEPVCAVFVPAH